LSAPSGLSVGPLWCAQLSCCRLQRWGWGHRAQSCHCRSCKGAIALVVWLGGLGWVSGLACRFCVGRFGCLWVSLVRFVGRFVCQLHGAVVAGRLVGMSIGLLANYFWCAAVLLQVSASGARPGPPGCFRPPPVLHEFACLRPKGCVLTGCVVCLFLFC